MEEPEYRVFVRIPVPRPAGFIDPPSFVWNAEKESTLWNVISRRNRGDINWNELAGIFQVDVPFLLQQAHFLYEKQLEELQLQMQRVNSSTSLPGQSKGSAESSRTSGQLEIPAIQRPPIGIRPTPSPLSQNRSSSPRVASTSPQQQIHSSFQRRKSSAASSPLVPEIRKSPAESLTTSTTSNQSTSSAAALRLFRQQQEQQPDDEEEEPAFLPSSRQTSRPGTSHAPPTTTTTTTTTAEAAANDSSNPGSDSFSDLSDAGISRSALEEALEEHLRRGGSVAGSQMQGEGGGGGVRSIWKAKFTG